MPKPCSSGRPPAGTAAPPAHCALDEADEDDDVEDASPEAPGAHRSNLHYPNSSTTLPLALSKNGTQLDTASPSQHRSPEHLGTASPSMTTNGTPPTYITQKTHHHALPTKPNKYNANYRTTLKAGTTVHF